MRKRRTLPRIRRRAKRQNSDDFDLEDELEREPVEGYPADEKSQDN